MHALLPLFFFLAQPFWDLRPPEKWSEREISQMRADSPWAQTIGPSPQVVVYLATAAPIELAEAELRLRSKASLPPPDPDYLTYLSEKRDENFVLAVTYPRRARLGLEEEERRLEEATVMLIGRQEYKIIGHFPPTPSDPVLRLVFPRAVKTSDKRVLFRLYLPGVHFPDREAEFVVKDLLYHGKLEM